MDYLLHPATTTTTRMTTYESIPEQPIASTSTDTPHEPPVHTHPLISRPFRSPNTPTVPRNNRGCGFMTRGRPLRQRFAEGSRRQRQSSNEEALVFDSDAEHNNNT